MFPAWNSMAFACFHVIQHVNTAPLHLRFGGGTREITVSASIAWGTLLFLSLFEIKTMYWWLGGRVFGTVASQKVLGLIPGWGGPFCVAFACSPRVCESFSRSGFPHNHLNVSQVKTRSQSSAKNYRWRSGSGTWELQRGGELLLAVKSFIVLCVCDR